MSEKKNESLNVDVYADVDLKADKVTNKISKEKNDFLEKQQEANVAATEQLLYDDFDPYEELKNKADEDDEDFDISYSGSETIIKAPHFVRRKKAGVKDGFQYYDYYVGFKIVVDPEDRDQDIKQTLFLDPEAGHQGIHRILNLVYKGTDMVPLEVVKTKTTQTRNGRRITDTRFSFRVSGKDGSGYPVAVPMKAASGNKVLLDVLLERYKASGVIN